MSPGHCLTDMGGSDALRTSMEGATSIYDLIKGDYTSKIFYHTGNEADYFNCGWSLNAMWLCKDMGNKISSFF